MSKYCAQQCRGGYSSAGVNTYPESVDENEDIIRSDGEHQERYDLKDDECHIKSHITVQPYRTGHGYQHDQDS